MTRLRILHQILNEKAVRFVNNPTSKLKEEIEAIKDEIAKIEGAE